MCSVRILEWNLALTLCIKRGKRVEFKVIQLPNGEVIRSLKEGENYEYLGILQVNHMKQAEIFKKS